jgi:cyclohexanone monooxygenase
VQKCNEVMMEGYQGFIIEGADAGAAQTPQSPRVRCTERWHVPLDVEVLSPAIIAARRVPVV